MTFLILFHNVSSLRTQNWLLAAMLDFKASDIIVLWEITGGARGKEKLEGSHRPLDVLHVAAIGMAFQNL